MKKNKSPVQKTYAQEILPQYIPALHDQYYKSRKQLALYSALLFAWEFVGIRLPNRPFTQIDIEIMTPQAAPWIFIVLILYFGHRTILEWLQSPTERRQLIASKMDFYTTICIPIAALLVFSVQRILAIQIADEIMPAPEHKSNDSLAGLFSVWGAWILSATLVLIALRNGAYRRKGIIIWDVANTIFVPIFMVAGLNIITLPFATGNRFLSLLILLPTILLPSSVQVSMIANWLFRKIALEVPRSKLPHD